jgi:type III restriction enzyme
MHTAISTFVAKHGGLDKKYFNESSLAAFAARFQEWKNANLQGRFRYAKSNVPIGDTVLAYADGTPREEITRGRVGTKISEGTPSPKYLYDTIAYDSPLEQKNILAGIEKVVVYAKIPRSSIAIPTITGGTYSPDFMYVVKKLTGEKELNIVVETKDVENKTELRGTESAKINCAEVFFDRLTKDGYTVHFRKQLGNKQMKQIVDEVLA